MNREGAKDTKSEKEEDAVLPTLRERLRRTRSLRLRGLIIRYWDKSGKNSTQ